VLAIRMGCRIVEIVVVFEVTQEVRLPPVSIGAVADGTTNSVVVTVPDKPGEDTWILPYLPVLCGNLLYAAVARTHCCCR